MKRFLAFLLCCAPAAVAAIDGVVINRTNDQPQAGATVALFKLGQNGPEQIDQAKSDAQGKFSIAQQTAGPMPYLLRTAFEGVTYNHMLPPGLPTTGLTLDVYNSSKQPGSAKVSKHMIFFEPAGSEMSVDEAYIFLNDSKTAWNDPENGTLKFYLPLATKGNVQVKVTAPGGMPIPAAAEKTSRPDVFMVPTAIKPGETRIDLAYTVPYKDGETYEGRVVTKDDTTYLVIPKGVSMSGANLTDMNIEPRTQAHVYILKGAVYKVDLSGAPLESSPSADAGQESNGPAYEPMMPRVFGKAKWILALTLGILAIGFTLLYRAPAPQIAAKEPNARGRR
jgi:hypothetical protein